MRRGEMGSGRNACHTPVTVAFAPAQRPMPSRASSSAVAGPASVPGGAW